MSLVIAEARFTMRRCLGFIEDFENILKAFELDRLGLLDVICAADIPLFRFRVELGKVRCARKIGQLLHQDINCRALV